MENFIDRRDADNRALRQSGRLRNHRETFEHRLFQRGPEKFQQYLLSYFLHLVHIRCHGTLLAHLSKAAPGIPNAPRRKVYQEKKRQLQTNNRSDGEAAAVDANTMLITWLGRQTICSDPRGPRSWAGTPRTVRTWPACTGHRNAASSRRRAGRNLQDNAECPEPVCE